MDLDDTPEQAAYRAQVQTWLAEHKSEAPIISGPGALKDEAEIVAARRLALGVEAGKQRKFFRHSVYIGCIAAAYGSKLTLPDQALSEV